MTKKKFINEINCMLANLFPATRMIHKGYLNPLNKYVRFFDKHRLLSNKGYDSIPGKAPVIFSSLVPCFAGMELLILYTVFIHTNKHYYRSPVKVLLLDSLLTHSFECFLKSPVSSIKQTAMAGFDRNLSLIKQKNPLLYYYESLFSLLHKMEICPYKKVNSKSFQDWKRLVDKGKKFKI